MIGILNQELEFIMNVNKIEHNGLLAFCGLFVIFFVCYFTNQQEKEKEKKKKKGKKEKRKKENDNYINAHTMHTN